MAVPIEFCTVILRKAQLAACFPGGLDAVFTLCDAPTYLEDDHLVRVSFMATQRAETLVERIAGMLARKPSEVFDCAVLDRAADPSTVPSWLKVGTIDDTTCAWLAGSAPGPVIQMPRCFGARFFRIPFSRISEHLGTLGVTVERSVTDSQAVDASFARGRARLDALLGIDDQEVVYGLMTFVPRTRAVDSHSHEQLLVDIEATLRQLGWKGAS